MNQYLVELQKYSEEGALTNEYSYAYVDTPQKLADAVTMYNKERYITFDDEGKAVIGWKMYKVTPKKGVYASIDDFNLFCEINGVLYHQ